jgi:hypothetical protein
MCEKANPVARLTVTHANGQQTIVEVHDDASFSGFYRWYRRNAGQDEKHYMRCTNRIDARDLEQLGAQIKENWKRLAAYKPARGKWNGHLVTETKVVLFDAEKYVQFLDCDPQQLPGGIQRNRTAEILAKPAPQRQALPIGYTPLQRRMDILTGRA